MRYRRRPNSRISVTRETPEWEERARSSYSSTGYNSRNRRNSGRKSIRQRFAFLTGSSAPKTTRRTGSDRRWLETLKADFKSGRIPLILALLAVGVFIYWLLTAPNFKVTNIKVNGSRYLNSQGVIATTGVDQQNVFLLKEDEVAEKIKKMPFVLDAKVSKSLPNELKVDITERKIGAVWKAGSVYYLTSPDGVVLESAAALKDEQTSMVQINSLDSSPLKVGDRVDELAISSAPVIADRVKKAGISIASLDYSPTSGLIIVSAGPDGKPGPWRALFGTGAELDKKLNLLQVLLNRKDLKWNFVDLRFTDRPVFS
jgi:hypothetical protein